MSTRSRRGPRLPMFRPDPRVARRARAAAAVTPSRPARPATPWPWPLPAARPDLWTKVLIRRQDRDSKATLLRVGGILLVVLGMGSVTYLAAAAWMGEATAGRAQERLSDQFQQSLAAADEDDPTIGSTPPTSSITVTTTPGEDVAGPEIRPAVPALIAETPPERGQALGHIVIPAAAVDWMVVEGVSPDDLVQGPGHMPGTALPGQPGNAVISGHRTTHGAPFRELDLLEPGDTIIVDTLIGTHTYQVIEVIIVAPSDVWVTDQVAGAWLTLTTCHPEGSSRERLIVFARLVSGPNAAAIPAGDEPPHPG